MSRLKGVAAMLYLDTHVVVWLFEKDDTRLSGRPRELIEAHDRGIGRSVASSTRYRCTDVLRYVESAWKSRALCDVQDLSRRLNTRPTTHLSRLRLRDNGLWSAIWMLRYCRSDTMDLAGMGAILGTRKRDAIRRGK